jgi:uncharacterized protein YdeI (YjbR/CyaY-like superfamily)
MSTLENEVESFSPSSTAEWRQWLLENHEKKQAVWLVLYKKTANKPTIGWGEAVDEALCFGWIDSIAKSIDGERRKQFFSKRKPNGTWSKINKEKVAKFIAEGKMRSAGLKCIEIAKQNGSWTILDEVEALIIPTDLEDAFKEFSGSKDFFLNLSRSNKKAVLQWIVLAKRAETRAKRVNEVAELASKNLKPKHLL